MKRDSPGIQLVVNGVGEGDSTRMSTSKTADKGVENGTYGLELNQRNPQPLHYLALIYISSSPSFLPALKSIPF